MADLEFKRAYDISSDKIHEPKISNVEVFFLLVLALIADLLSIIPIVNIIVGIFALIIGQFYYRVKGVKPHYALVGNLIEFIPFLSILPTYIASTAATIYFDRKPAKSSAIHESTEEVKQKVKRFNEEAANRMAAANARRQAQIQGEESEE